MKKKLVIVGAGFAGRFTYLSLSKAVRNHYSITIIDNDDHFLFTPLLHEVAVGGITKESVCQDIHSFVDSSTTVLVDRVVAFDHVNQLVTLEQGETINYDCLVFAIGSKTNFFSTKGAEEHSSVLKNVQNALDIKAKVTQLIASQRKGVINVIGGGPTGIELACELADWLHQKNSILEVKVYNGGPSILGPFSETSQQYAQEVLKKKGVFVFNNIRITELSEDTIYSSEGDAFPSSLTIWAAGVQPEVVDSKHDILHVNHRLQVNECLTLPDNEKVFVLGDVALAPTSDQKGFPMLAQVAKQQGIHTAKNIERQILNKPLIPFKYVHRGSLASLGHYHAIVEIGNIKIYGFFAWLIWKALYLITFNSMKHRFTLLKEWNKKRS